MVPRYEGLLTGAEQVESSLHESFVEHLNSEIVIGTIKDVSMAVSWLRQTFLFIRMRQHPSHYGLGASRPTDQQVGQGTLHSL